MHTLVSHVRGPRDRLTFAGAEIVEAVPIGVGEGGNLPVCFEVLSYAGRLSISVVADPDHFPEVADLTTFLGAELETLTHLDAGPSRHDPSRHDPSRHDPAR
jgi:hypothetical protein